jgi:NMD protein affecting ribosome stability and mRNA decay
MAFCPNCGKKTERGFCDKCRPVPELKIKDIKVEICAVCGKYFYKNKWTPGKTDEAIIRLAKDAVKGRADVTVDLPELKKKPGVKADVPVEIDREGDLFTVPAKIEFSYCNLCAKKQGQYFEGTIQLRNISDEMLEFARKYLKENDAFASNIKEIKDGYDMDISDQRKLQTLGQQLKKTFGGTLKVSIRQFTQDKQTSRQIYRVNALYEGPKYKKGEVIKTEKGLFLLTNVSEKVSAVDLKTGKKTTLHIHDKEMEVLPKKDARVTKIYPHIEVLNSETFQNVVVENNPEVRINEKVKIVNDNGLFYCVRTN